jgi:hypothetical protein
MRGARDGSRSIRETASVYAKRPVWLLMAESGENRSEMRPQPDTFADAPSKEGGGKNRSFLTVSLGSKDAKACSNLTIRRHPHELVA